MHRSSKREAEAAVFLHDPRPCSKPVRTGLDYDHPKKTCTYSEELAVKTEDLHTQ